jgi:hypothetical protein
MNWEQYWNAHLERNPKVKKAVTEGTAETTTVTVKVSSLKVLLREAFTKGEENARRRADDNPLPDMFKDFFGPGFGGGGRK